ncbi:MAG: hypothetical protein ACTSUE_20635 [Promethearchaeota archaeon]
MITIALKDKRTYFVANKVVHSFVVFIFLSVGLTLYFERAGNTRVQAIMNLWPACIVLPAISILLFMFAKQWFFFKLHWIFIVLALAIIWLPIVVITGVFLDLQFFGEYVSIWVQLNLGASYIVGYYLARWFRKNRFNEGRVKLLSLALLMLVLSVFAGIILSFVISLALYGFSSTSSPIGAYHVLGASMGILVSMLSNYYMFHALFDTAGMDVISDPPNKLIYVCLRNTIIIMLLMWFFLFTLIPPVPVIGAGLMRNPSKTENLGKYPTKGEFRDHRDALKKQVIHEARSGKFTAGKMLSISDQANFIIMKKWYQMHL